MRIILFCALATIFGCSDDKSDTAGDSVVCPGDSVQVEVCVECGDAGGCDEMGLECRSICDADEDCPDTHVCTSSSEEGIGMYCAERDQCE